MEKYCWKEEYSLGFEKVDRQHQHMFEIVNKLSQHAGPTEDIDFISEILTEMVNYARKHFADEEGLMQEHGFPGIESHKKQHDYFINTTAELIINFMHNRQTTVDEITEFLVLWLTTHILKWDMKYRDFFRTQIAAGAICSI
jgi:hemerythrin-like metal-binding protein